MIRYYTILLILLFSASLKAQQKVYIDNEEIQEYKGKLGKWTLIDSKKSLISFSKKYLTDINEIYNINNIDKTKSQQKYYFIPYSKDYLTELEIKNIRRDVIISSEKDFIWPIIDPIKISSVLGFRNGKFHPGLDLPVPRGKPILASMEGLVIFAGYTDGYGWIIVIKHGNNYITKYAHNSSNFVKKGDFVKKGQIIGLSGSTGHATGNHLHFEIRCMDIPLDPLDFLPLKKDLHIIHTLKNWK